MMEGQQHGEQPKRGLKNRHVQLIALSNVIGTGLSLSSASIIQFVGSRIIPGYAITGSTAFLIIRQLGEMVVEKPVAGSSNHFAYKYWGSFAGLASDWSYWVLYVLAATAEPAAVGKYIQFRYLEIPIWVSATVSFVVINVINLASVKVFDGMEFWFAIIKVIVVVVMIIFGGWLLSSDNGGPQAAANDLWDQGDFLPHDFAGLAMMMAVTTFSFGGLELVGITVVEADDPKQSIPKTTNQVIYRILIFHISSLAVLLLLMSWTCVTADTSPFVLIFYRLGGTFVANALSIVILTAALSVYNNCVYCNGRILFGLAQQGNAPKALASVDKRGVPVNTILMSALITVLCVLINYFVPESALRLLMALVVSALVINWVMISLAHMKLRRTKQKQDVVTRFLALLYPLGSWICLPFMAAVLVIMLMASGMAISVYLILVRPIVLDIGYLFKRKTTKAVKTH